VKIGGYRRERRDGRVVVAARIEWEDAPLSPLELAFTTEDGAAGHISPEPNAFLLAAALPAARRGERRIAISGAVCPVLRDGIAAAARVLDGWYGGRRTLPRIEPAGGFRAPLPPARRTASFLSGGVDSAELLLANRRLFGADHPETITDAVVLDGFPQAPPRGSDADRSFTARVRRSARAVAAALEVPLTSVSANLFDLEPDHTFAWREWYGAAFAAIAHLFTSRFTSVVLASEFFLGGPMYPNGSHPLLDPLYGSASMGFIAGGIGRTRLEKVRHLAARPDVVAALMVCHETPVPGDPANCGRCEKCLRTRLELLVAGVESTPAFPGALAPNPADIAAARPAVPFRSYWRPLAGPLRAAGRADLAEAVEARVAESDRIEAWSADAGWKGRLRRADRRLFGGRGLALRRRILRPPAS
jgi:hypothetical protein